jgi:hypothetical protein
MAKKIKKAILAGLAAYAAAKMMKKAPVEGLSTDKFDMKAKKVFMHDLEAKAPIKGGTGVPDFVKSKITGTSGPKTWKEKWLPWWKEGGSISASTWKKHGGAIKTQHARMGKMIKAAQGTQVRSGKMLKARYGTEVRTMGSNPHVPSGGTAYVKTKLNGTLKVKTF